MAVHACGVPKFGFFLQIGLIRRCDPSFDTLQPSRVTRVAAVSSFDVMERDRELRENRRPRRRWLRRLERRPLSRPGGVDRESRLRA
jgi:hypothetical protein